MGALAGLFFATVAGILWAGIVEPWRWWLLAASAVLLGGSAIRPLRTVQVPALTPFLLIPAVLAASASWAQWRHPHPMANDLVYHAPLSRAMLEGVVVSEPQCKTESVSFTFRAQRLLAPRIAVVQGMVQVTVNLQEGQRLEPGMALRIRGRIRRPPPARRPGGFSFRDYLNRRGIFTVMQVLPGQKVEVLPDKGSTDLRRWIGRWRRHLLTAQVPGLRPEAGALFGSLVLGDRASPLPESIRNEFRDVGLAAVLAASGMQVSLLLGLCLWIGDRAGASDRLTALLSAPALLLYALLTGYPPSIQRATLVGLLALLGRFWSLKVQPVAALLLAGWVIVIVDPASVYDLGLILSLLATLGVLHTAPLLARKMTALPISLAQFLALPLGAQLWVLPVQICTFEVFSLLFLPANALAAPLVEVLTYSGVATAGIGMVSTELAGWCNLLNGLVLELLLGWVHFLAAMPGARWTVRSPSWTTVVLAYPALFGFLEAWRVEETPARQTWRCLGLLCLQMALLIGFQQRTLPDFRLTVVASGGIAAAVVQQAGYPDLLLGGGSRLRLGGRVWDAGEQVLAPLLDHLGVDRLVVVPMPPYGHSCRGLMTLLERSPVRQLWDVGGYPEVPAYRELWEGAWRREIPAARLWPGDRLILGPRLELQVLSAPSRGDDPFLVRLTAGSLSVLWAESVHRSWEPPPQLDLSAEWLITSARDLPPSFLEAVRPRTILSTGLRRPTFQPTGVEVIRPAEDGPLQWEEAGEG